MLTLAQPREKAEKAEKASQAQVEGEGEEGGIGAAKDEYAESETPKVQGVDSLPAPTVRPTAYSARYSVVPGEAVKWKGKEKVLSPSPPSAGSEELETSSTVRAETPTGNEELGAVKMLFTEIADITEGTQPRTQVRPSTVPPGGDVGRLAGDGMGSQSKHDPERDETSSAVEGEAANRLLELIRAAIDL